MDPLKQLNEQSCVVASFVFEMNRGGLEVDQESFIQNHLEVFPKWNERPGVAYPWELFRMLELVGKSPGDFIATKSIDEAVNYMSEMNPYAGFVWSRRKIVAGGGSQAGDHCMAFRRCLKEGGVEVMDPWVPSFRVIDRRTFEATDSTVLLCSEHTQKKAFRAK